MIVQLRVRTNIRTLEILRCYLGRYSDRYLVDKAEIPDKDSR